MPSEDSYFLIASARNCPVRRAKDDFMIEVVAARLATCGKLYHTRFRMMLPIAPRRDADLSPIGGIGRLDI